MDNTQIVDDLTVGPTFVTAKEGEKIVPPKSGLYSIFINSPTELPAPFSDILTRKNTTLLYVGKASNSLNARLVEQDLRHKSPSTFFRGIGTILGYTPAPGSLKGKHNQNNYKFDKNDTNLIIQWINEYLFLRWICLEPFFTEQVEPEIIRILRPLLNSTHNPDSSSELAELRERCRNIARN